MAGAGKNSDIETLRAVAVCFVLYHHARDMMIPAGQAFVDPLGFGPAGVDLFFVISGFVIGRSLLPRLQSCASFRTQWLEILAFWTRRAFRLLPTAWLWLAIILAATGVFAFQHPFLGFDVNLGATLAGVFYYANFRFAEALGEGAPYGVSFHYWTLSLEEQFYILLPLFALLGRKWFVAALFGVIILDQARGPTGYAIITRASGLLLGVLMAIWSEKPSFQMLKTRAEKAPAICLGICLLAAALLPLLENMRAFPLKYGVIAVTAAAAVLVASFNRNIVTPQRAFRDIALWLGSRSYALYVIHVPLFYVMFDLTTRELIFGQTNAPVLLVLAFAILAILCEVNFRFLERPLRNYGVRLSARIAAKSAGSALTPATSLQPPSRPSSSSVHPNAP